MVALSSDNRDVSERIPWGRPVRLAGGHLTHRAGADIDGTAWLAHGGYAWSDRLSPAGEDAPDCARCARNLPQLAHQARRAVEEGIAKQCGCGRLAFWPGFACGGCGLVVAAGEPAAAGD
jgi:hypothetical protein